VSSEGARWRKLSEAMPNHVLCDVHRHMAPTIVHGNGVSHHLGKDYRSARPSSDDTLFTTLVHRFDLSQ
jgi:hypothetical protein